MIGIDFGTTNTSVAIPGDLYGPTRTISLRPQNTQPYDAVLASAVLDPLSGEPVIGRRAQEVYNQASDRQAHAFLNYFKPHLDRQRLRERRWVEVGPGRIEYDFVNQNDRVIADHAWVEVGGEFSRREIVASLAAIFDFALGQAAAEGAEADRVLLGLPVSFSSRARKRLMAALYETGRFASYRDLLSRVRFVHEPVAAAAEIMATSFDAEDVENVLVFDHGGGTLDLSIIRFERRDGFEFPVPRMEMAAGGADDVAGRRIDQELRRELERDTEILAAFEENHPWDVANALEACKVQLSVRESAPIPLADVILSADRRMFERAMRPILARIHVELERVCQRAGLEPSDISRVVMTGGSSLIPCVQDEVRGFFGHLDEYRLRAYDAASVEPGGDVERAITEVAQGLVRYAETNTLRHVVHWDVDVMTSESRRFHRIASQGDRFDVTVDGRPQLVRRFRVRDVNADGMCFGLYEHQLDRNFVFGLADVPRGTESAILEIHLRPDALFPGIRLCDENGHVLSGNGSRSRALAADVELLTEADLEDFFDCDVEYLPDSRFTRFEHAPLERRLRVDDEIEWTRLGRAGSLLRFHGVVERIIRSGEGVALDEMDTWELSDFRLYVRCEGACWRWIEPHPGYIRLAPRSHQRL